MASGEAARGRPDGLVRLAAPAPEVGRIFLKHLFDGRPITLRAKPSDGALIARRSQALSLVRRRGEWLFVILIKLSEDAPQQIGGELRVCLDRALDSLPSPPTSGGNRRDSARGKGLAR